MIGKTSKQNTQMLDSSLRLEKAKLDLSSVRVQSCIGIILILISCFATYWPILSVNGRLAGETPSRSDCLWLRVPSGIDIFLYVGCCILVSGISLQISRLYGQKLRAAAAIWTGLLFTTCPVHYYSFRGMGGLESTFGCLVLLASIYSYLRFRILNEQIYWFLSLASFGVSMFFGYEGMILPAVLLCAEIILPFNSHLNKCTLSPKVVFAALLPYFSLSLVYLMCQGNSDHTLMIRLDHFLCSTHFLKAYVEGYLCSNALKLTCAITAVYFILRLINKQVFWRPYLFFIAWMLSLLMPLFMMPGNILLSLPYYQALFVSSAPICMFITFSLLPVMEKVSYRMARFETCFGVCILFAIYLMWSSALHSQVVSSFH